MRCEWRIHADAAIPSLSIHTAMIFSATATASSTRAPFAGSKPDQVFTRRYSDHFRNRLTHTIEVAQIARTVAAQLGLNVDLVKPSR